MDCDSAGNLYIASGDTIDGAANAYRGGYTNAHPSTPLPATRRPSLDRRRARDRGQHERLRGQAAADQAARGPRPGARRRQDVHDPRRGRPERSEPVRARRPARASRRSSRWASPTCARSTSTPKTDTISAAWSGTEQQNNSVTVGPGEDRERRAHHGRRQLRLAVLRGRQPLRLPLHAAGRSAAAARPTSAGPTRRAARSAAAPTRRPTGAFWDCSKSLPNDSPFNTGLADIPAPKPVNVWYGPQGGCYDFPRNANGVARLQRHQHQHRDGHGAAVPVGARRRPVRRERRHLPAPGAGQGRRVARVLGRPLVPGRLRAAPQRAPRAADGPGHRGRRRPARRGRLAVRDPPGGPARRTG